MYGILALAVVDSVSAMITKILPKPRLYKHSLWSVVITYGAFLAVLAAAGAGIWRAMLIALVAVAAENLGIEDNLTLPIATSAIAYVLRAPTPPI